MTTIERMHLGAGVQAGRLWTEAALRVTEHLAARRLPLRDSIVLVPFAALLEPVRTAFAALGGWQPRVETPLTLASALGPADEVSAGQCSGDAVLDRLQAAQWLRRGGFGDGPIDLEHAAALLAEAAQVLVQAAAERAPLRRAAYWSQLRDALAAPAVGPGAVETILLQAAVQWAATAPVPATDRLFALRPAAWVVVRIGGADELAESVLEQSASGGVLLDLDPPVDEPFAPWVGTVQPEVLRCADFEDEAMAAAAAVIHALQASADPVALVALDRVLVRRVLALLRRHDIAVNDETGWKLSTTADAARVIGRLRAASAHASDDDRLDWLKSWAPAARTRPQAVETLEALWRGRGQGLDAASFEAARSLWAEAEAVLAAWREPPQRALTDWLDLLRRQLESDGSLRRMQADVVAARLLQCLRLDAPTAAWRTAAAAAQMDLPAFTRWVESACESETTPLVSRPGARVVLTPLARAVGRDFGHVVLPAMDAQHLGAEPMASGLIHPGWAERQGLAGVARQRMRQRLALAQLLRVPRLTLSWRSHDGDESRTPSPELEWLQAAWARAGGAALPVRDWQAEQRQVPRSGVPRPLPCAAQALPLALSASAVEKLRQCPYRFFARVVLHLDEVDELEAPLHKRDFGNWLHAVLDRFHRERSQATAGDDEAALRAAAEQCMVELELDAAQLLPYRASLEPLIPAYLAWLQRQEASGWRWRAGEDELRAEPAEWAPQTLRGRIDRIDAGPQGAQRVIDYKTGAAQQLKNKVAEPLEDTQLAFYAALLRAQGGGPISAAYVALDDRDAPVVIEHPEVEATAQAMLAGLGLELARLRAGAPLAALGEGRVCEVCEARGLCRRDHWAEP